jgi:radical SAM superfamily enzyme YgiQ (UPF0313 family)
LLPPELLQALKRVGLTSITFGVETPSDPTLRNYRRQPIDKDRQHAFIATCRALGIRTVAGFMIGFPEDTEYSIRQVLRYALSLGPTFANFNVVTPYPGTAFFEQMRDRLGTIDYSLFNVYTPLLTYDHLTPQRVEELLGKCFRRYYFRWQYLRENAALLWPWLRRLGLGAAPRVEVFAASCDGRQALRLHQANDLRADRQLQGGDRLVGHLRPEDRPDVYGHEDRVLHGQQAADGAP